MGKNRHSKDKLYIVASEYASDWGGYKTQNNKLPFRCLPFDCCFLSLLPFKNPLGTVDGLVFDAEEITTYIKQYGHNPITGKPLTMKDLFVLRFHKNSEGKYFCPVTEKQFNNHSFIVANRKTGHVYSNEAIDILCRKTKHWFDLITNEPFTATDLVIIQNPNNYALREIENFYYRKEGKTW
jgi:peptidyl-prolyl cis-trans isomerase-like 2